MDRQVDGDTTWLLNPGAIRAFDKKLFDPHWIKNQGYLTGAPHGGRGNTVFFKFGNSHLVLREYLRGGLVRHVNRHHYLWQGLQRTRAFQEMQILNTCASMQLPTPLAYASQIKRRGPIYTASLITYRLEGETFADIIKGGRASEAIWSAVGSTVAKLHDHGIWHADLNAHNILVDGNDKVSLIDFDRARHYEKARLPAHGNIDRLHRSLQKEAKKHSAVFDSTAWNTLLSAYELARCNSKSA